MKKVLLAIASMSLMAACAPVPKVPMVLDKSYKTLENRDSCNCNYSLSGTNLLKHSEFKAFAGPQRLDYLNTDTLEVIKTARGSDEYRAAIRHNFQQNPSGELSEKNNTLKVNIADRQYNLKLPIEQNPKLFKTGFVFGSLKFVDALETKDKLFVLLQKPGTAFGFIYDRNSKAFEKKFFQDSFPYKGAIGQIFSTLSVISGGSSTDLIIKTHLMEDSHTGTVYLAYSEVKETQTGNKHSRYAAPTIERKAGSQLLYVYDKNGNKQGDFTDNINEAYFYAMNLFGDVLVDPISKTAINRHTGIKVNFENAGNIRDIDQAGIIFYDPSNKNYYFKKNPAL